MTAWRWLGRGDENRSVLMILSIGSLLANRSHRNIVRVRQHEFTHFDCGLAQGKTRKQMPGRLFGESFDQSIIPLRDEFFQRRGDFGVIYCISDMIPWSGSFRPERYIEDQTLRLRALRFRYTHARTNFKLFDVDAIDHDR